jgi:hypothetical protein
MSQEPSTAKLAQDYADEHAPLFGMDAIAYGVLGMLASLFNLVLFSLLSGASLFDKDPFAFCTAVAVGFIVPYAIVQHRKNTHLRLLREELERQEAIAGDNG